MTDMHLHQAELRDYCVPQMGHATGMEMTRVCVLRNRKWPELVSRQHRSLSSKTLDDDFKDRDVGATSPINREKTACLRVPVDDLA